MRDGFGIAPRYVGRASLAASVAAAVMGALVVSAALTGGASPYPIAPDLFVVALLIGFVLAFLHIGLLGLPLYLVLSQRWRLRCWSAVLGGIFVGAAPTILVVGIPMSANSLSEAFGVVAWMGAYGAVAGLVFFSVLERGARAQPD